MEDGKSVHQMKHGVALTVSSLLSILFMSFHHSDDVARGMASGGFSNLIPILILVAWLFATLALAGRKSGYIIILLGSLFSAGMPFVHMTGSGLVGGNLAGTTGAFFFVWTLIALGVTALFTAILSASGLWDLRRGKSR